MDIISRETAKEIDRRLAAGPYHSADELLADAFRALDEAQLSAQAWLEAELIEGLDGDSQVAGAEFWDKVEHDAMNAIESKKAT